MQAGRSDAPGTREAHPVGVVAIGRNEGTRLERCLRSLAEQRLPIVYVDSGSTDDSLAIAERAGASLVRLDMSTPFSAARARNAGRARLRELRPDLPFLQFIDGDCELSPAWLDAALAEMTAARDAAVVCGRRRERMAGRSLYNRLMDMEWNTPIGDATACGGDALMRADAFDAVGGFDPSLIAGEEPDLCLRLRRRGGRIRRIAADMTWHDADMTRFSQWWQRSIRGGYAFALGRAKHAGSPERHWVKESRSIWLWGAGLPLASLVLAWPSAGLSLSLWLAYPLWALRIARGRVRRCGDRVADALLYGAFCMLGKLPQLVGQLRFHRHRLAQQPARLIEYK